MHIIISVVVWTKSIISMLLPYMIYTDGQPLVLDDIEKDLPANSSKILTESKWTFITQEVTFFCVML